MHDKDAIREPTNDEGSKEEEEGEGVWPMKSYKVPVLAANSFRRSMASRFDLSLRGSAVRWCVTARDLAESFVRQGVTSRPGNG